MEENKILKNRMAYDILSYFNGMNLKSCYERYKDYLSNEKKLLKTLSPNDIDLVVRESVYYILNKEISRYFYEENYNYNNLIPILSKNYYIIEALKYAIPKFESSNNETKKVRKIIDDCIDDILTSLTYL